MEVQTRSTARAESSRTSEAESLFVSARYAECIRICDANGDLEHALLAASAALRRRDYDDAVARGSSLLPICSEADQRARIAGILALSNAALQRHDVAAEIIGRISESELSRSARLWFAYDRAAALWAAGEYGATDLLLRSCDYSAHPVEKAYADFLRSWVLAKEQRYVEQALLLRNTIRALCSAAVQDVGTIARALHALSVTCREVHIPAVTSLLQSLPRTLPWTDDLAYEHFHTLRNVGWHHALQGNYIPAIRHLDLAKRIAPSPYALLISCLDHAQIANVSGESLTFQAQLDQAVEMLESLTAEPTGDEVLTLVVAAEVLAPNDVVRSRSALKRFRLLRHRMRASFALSNDERTQAMYAYAAAALAERDGRTTHAAAYAMRALQVFRSIGFKWRSSRAALLLYRCTRDERYLAAARENARDYPRSFLHDEIEAARSVVGSGLERLTSRQRQVLYLLVEGLTVNEVAHRLDASPNTIKAHKNRIYSMLRVRNRVELSRVVTSASTLTSAQTP
jgi:DNA-binding CsgD family transcriptional regulator